MVQRITELSDISMARNKFIPRCFLCVIISVLKLFLLLVVVNNHTIANGEENSTGIECSQELVKQWHWVYWSDFNSTGIRCSIQCSPNCTCILDDVNVISDCTDGNVKVTQVGYPSTVRYLSWDDSILHIIKQRSFLRFGSTLQRLHLNNIHLQYLQPGVFAGLTDLRNLHITSNRLTNILAGVFGELSNLKRLFLEVNMLSEIHVRDFSGMVSLEWLYLRMNMIREIEMGVFDDLNQILGLLLHNNMLLEIQVGVFRKMINVMWLDLNSNLIQKIETGAFDDLIQLTQLNLWNNRLSEIQFEVFRGMSSLVTLDLDNNYIAHEIESETFKDLAQLSKLHLRNNMLSSIKAGVFKEMVNLEKIDLGYNIIREVEAGSFEELVQLRYLYLAENMLSDIQVGVFRGLVSLEVLLTKNNIIQRIETGSFDDLVELKKLWLNGNMISQIQVGAFRGMPNLSWLSLANNLILRIEARAFETVGNLIVLSLSNNSFSTLHSKIFQHLNKLQVLELQHNKLESLPEVIFHNLLEVRYLNLSFNNVNRVLTKLFLHCTSLETLDLQGNALLWIEQDALNGIDNTVTVAVSDFATCCFTTANCISPPPQSPYLTCKRLLPYDLLRITLWFVSSFAILGNVFVFYTKFRQKQEGNKVQVFLITNLSVSDLFMGIYLVILLSADMYYKGYFPSHSESWRRSMLCRIAGAFSVWSSEASTFLITLITIDRYLGIKYTFCNFRLRIKSARIATVFLWAIACGIAVAVFVLSEQDSDTYSVSEICVGLPLSRRSFHFINETTINPSSSFENQKAQILNIINNGSKIAMFLSIALFTCLNLICFFIIGYCYLSMFIYVRQTTKQSGRSPNLNEEIRIAIKMSLIVLTDFCCWVPVGILSILVQTGMVVVDPVAYAWIATFVLPINSSINPFMYTLGSLALDKMKSSGTKVRKGPGKGKQVPMKSIPSSGRQTSNTQPSALNLTSSMSGSKNN